MEMSDELRVTVVAAGLDAQKEKALPRESVASRPEPTDYRKLQQPAVMRQQAARAEQEAAAAKKQQSQEKRKSAEMDDYLDIPAFRGARRTEHRASHDAHHSVTSICLVKRSFGDSEHRFQTI